MSTAPDASTTPAPAADGPRAARTLRPATVSVRGGQVRSEFQETSEPIYLTQGYVYDRAADAEAAFKGETDRFIYSRYGNPTVHMFEERLRLLDGAEACYATATARSSSPSGPPPSAPTRDSSSSSPRQASPPATVAR